MNYVEKLGKKIISQLTIGSKLGWPPDCMGFVYQPERPVQCSPDQDTSRQRMQEENKEK